jgi:hypothetical protein
MSARGRELSSLLRIPVIEVDLASKNTGLVSASELSAMANLWRTYRCAAVKLRQLWCAPDVSSGSGSANRSARKQTRVAECLLCGSEITSALGRARCQLGVDYCL